MPETLMERSMPEGRTVHRFEKHIKTSRTCHPIKQKHPPYAEMVQEALVSLPPSSYWPSGDLPSTSYECISSYILSKYPLVGEIHQLDHDVLLRKAIVKLSRVGILYRELTGRYVILPQFSSISAAAFRRPPPPPPPKSPSPPQCMEEDTAEVPVDIKRFILLPTGHAALIACGPPPPYPPPLWELPVDIKRFILLPTGHAALIASGPPPPYPPPLWELPVDIKRFILLPTGHVALIACGPPPPYPPPLWELGS